MNGYRPTIGLEIHAELSTKTKMFCDSPNAPHTLAPNTAICPVCMAHPGTLPVPNRQAVHHVLRVGAALGSTIASYTEFDRKSYFYPDIPKGYQISQFEYPLVKGGSLAGVDITRVHLEEDTARSSHDASKGTSIVDFNRAGVPLMELVTEPVLHDAQSAGMFARELQLLLRTLGVSHANLEKGEMRVEANISVSKDDTLGTKVEVKNLNSFRSVERAIAYEVERQVRVLEEGGKLTQETRGWDEGKQSTFSQRLKEGSADYRYFPDPDLPKMDLSEIEEFTPEALKASLPELPEARRARYLAYGLKEEDVAYLVDGGVRSSFMDQLFVECKEDQALIRQAVNYLVSDIAGWYTKSEKKEYEGLSVSAFAELMKLVVDGSLSSRGAKDVLALMLEGDSTSPKKLAEDKGLIQVSDPEALVATVQEVLAQNPEAIAQYKSGKESALQFLVGQAMKATRGAGNPATLKTLLEEGLAT
jgi:aspartyl-tRNA(Asn)/glutamyl-tRNA(Gln) amidotransferase subunit B